jgi:hypothetical protein
LIAAGHRSEAEVQIDQALEFYREVGAAFHIDRLELLRIGQPIARPAARAVGA